MQLNSTTACYSYEDLYESFAIAFNKIDFKRQEIKKVLVLGGGFCSIPQLLLKRNKNLQFDVVEIDKTIIDLAKKYVKPQILNACNLIESDAISFLEKKSTNKYDLVCIDIFIDQTVPDSILTNYSLNLIKSKLNENGLAVMSLLENGFSDKDKFINFISLFVGVFNSKVHRAESNTILIGKLS